MVDPPTFEEWVTPEMLELSEYYKKWQAYYDRAGNSISFAESMWQGVVDPGYYIVSHTHYSDGGKVSTVHLHFDHARGDGPPLIFETMVFNIDGWDDWQQRYTSEAEALFQHGATVARVDAGLTS